MSRTWTRAEHASKAVQWAWVGFDVALTCALFGLLHRWRSWLAGLLGGVIALDACLTTWQAVAYNAPRSSAVLDWIIIGVAVLAPSTAACLLGWAWRHPPPVYS